jgi:carbamoyl-phosphate synthase large subunit
MSDYNILVTGVGAIIGYGIINSLKKSRYDINVIGADIYPDAVGRIWSDKFIQAELARSDNFEDYLLAAIADHDIDLIIPGIEQDIEKCSSITGSIESAGAKLAINSNKALTLFNNKLLTYDLLRELNLPYLSYINAGTITPDDIRDNIGLPCIVKKKVSYAGKGLHVIENLDEAALYIGDTNYVFQQYENAGQEFTVSIFGLGDGSYVSPIALKRTLGPDGATHKASTLPFDEFQHDVSAMCAKACPTGPTNFQFIESGENIKKLLEVNPRISSSTSIREKLGVNEAEMCIEYYLEGKTPENRAVINGKAQRFIDEIIEYDSDHI